MFDTFPMEGDYAEKGSVVTIYVATNENPNASLVPNVIGYSQEIAKQLIEGAGFKLGNVTEQNSDKEKGVVIAQSPNGDEQADAGGAVSITISNGIPPETSVNISVTLPNAGSGATGVMKVYLNNSLYGSPKDVKLSGGTMSVEIKGTGVNNSYSILIDDTEIQTGKIDFSKSPAVVSGEEKHPENYKIAVVNVVGQSASNAYDTLETAGFGNIKIVDRSGKEVSSGTVVEQTPQQGEKIKPGDEIRLIVE